MRTSRRPPALSDHLVCATALGLEDKMFARRHWSCHRRVEQLRWDHGESRAQKQHQWKEGTETLPVSLGSLKHRPREDTEERAL